MQEELFEELLNAIQEITSIEAKVKSLLRLVVI